MSEIRGNGPGALSDLVVIEMGDEATQACGKLFGDMGATVIKIEPPGGVRSRHRGPFLDGHEGDPNASLYFWAHNTNKLSVVLDIADQEGRARLAVLLADADMLLVDDSIEYLPAAGLDYPQLCLEHPRLVYVSITPFGLSGPMQTWKGSDLVCWAMGGGMAMVGYTDHLTPPLVPQGDLTYQLAGQWACVGALAALAARDIENLGDHVDVSVQEAVAFATGGYGTAPFEYQNEMVRRSNLTNTVITRDGLYVVAQMLNITDEKWLSFKDWIVGQGVAGELTELPPAEFESNRSAVLQAVERVAKLWDADELCRLGQGFGFTWMKLNSVRDLFTDPQLRSRGFFREMEHRELGTAFEYGGPGAEWSEAGWSLRRRPPLLGEDNADYGVDA